jgi:hypothetical protein
MLPVSAAVAISTITAMATLVSVQQAFMRSLANASASSSD